MIPAEKKTLESTMEILRVESNVWWYMICWYATTWCFSHYGSTCSQCAFCLRNTRHSLRMIGHQPWRVSPAEFLVAAHKPNIINHIWVEFPSVSTIFKYEYQSFSTINYDWSLESIIFATASHYESSTQTGRKLLTQLAKLITLDPPWMNMRQLRPRPWLPSNWKLDQWQDARVGASWSWNHQLANRLTRRSSDDWHIIPLVLCQAAIMLKRAILGAIASATLKAGW